MAISGASLLLWGCGTFPPARVYILGDPGSPAAGVRDEAGLPHIDLRTVSVPDYLDTTEMTRRTASNDKVHSDSEQGTFIAAMTSRTDAAAALAMTSAIDQLASRIAITLTRDGAAH
jgi:hypothetical protein